MKTKMYVMFSLFSLPFLMLAQTDSLSVRSSFWTGTSIQNNGRNISFYQAKEIVKANTAAFEAMKKAQTNSGYSIAFQVAGGLGIGYTLASFMNSEDSSEVSWWQGAVGLGLTFISLSFETKAREHAQNAVDLYNAAPQPMGYRFQPEFEFNLGVNGLGLGMRF